VKGKKGYKIPLYYHGKDGMNTMKRKKLLTTILTAAMIAAFTLTGCGSKNTAVVDENIESAENEVRSVENGAERTRNEVGSITSDVENLSGNGVDVENAESMETALLEGEALKESTDTEAEEIGRTEAEAGAAETAGNSTGNTTRNTTNNTTGNTSNSASDNTVSTQSSKPGAAGIQSSASASTQSSTSVAHTQSSETAESTRYAYTPAILPIYGPDESEQTLATISGVGVSGSIDISVNPTTEETPADTPAVEESPVEQPKQEETVVETPVEKYMCSCGNFVTTNYDEMISHQKEHLFKGEAAHFGIASL
jgi:hypothetical protein